MLGSCLSTALEMDNLNLSQCIFQKIHSLSTGGAHSRVEAYIASPTSPPYVGKQLTALFHTQPLLKYLVYSIATPKVNGVFYRLKAHPKTLGHCHGRIDVYINSGTDCTH